MARDPHLDKLITDLKTKQFRDGEAKGLVQTIGDEIKSQLAPLFSSLAKDLSGNVSEAVKSAIVNLKVDVPKIDAPQVNVTVPDVHVPDFNIPTPKVTVNVPKADTPIVNVKPSDVNFPDSMALKGIDTKNPLPVRWIGADGKPMSINIPMGGGGGGRGDFFTIKDIQNSTGGSIIDNDGFVKVTGSFSVTASNSSTQAIDSSGNPYSQANPMPVVFSSTGSTASALIDSSGVQYSGSNPVPVVITSGASATSASNIVDSSGVAYSGSNPVPVTGSVAVSGVTGSIGATILNGEGVARDTWGSSQVGTWNIGTVTTLTGVTNSIAVMEVDSGGVAYSGSNPFPITGTVLASDITNSIKSALIDSSGVQYSGSNPVPISGAVSQSGTWNIGTVTTVTGITNTIGAMNVDSSGVGYSGSNPLPVALISGSLTSTGAYLLNGDGTYRDSMPVTGTVTVGSVTNSISAVLLDASGADWQPFVYGEGDAATAQRVVLANNAAYSVSASQVGTWNITTLTGITNTLASNIVDSSGVAYSGSNPVPVVFGASATQGVMWVDSSGVAYEGANPAPVSATQSGTWNVGTVTTVTGITNTVGAMNVDSSGVGYSGSNPLPITIISGAPSSTASVLTRQTNPTAVAADYVPLAADDLGRQLTRPIQVRDLIKTAYVALSTGTETTLLAGVAGAYLDLIMLTATNNSTAATQLDIRAVTGGNIIHTMNIPASTGPVGFAPSVPWPQDATGNNWTIDMPDQTGTTVYVSALFSQEV